MITIISDLSAKRLQTEDKVVDKVYSYQPPFKVDDVLHVVSQDMSIDHVVIVKHVEGPFKQQGRQNCGLPFYLLTLIKHDKL